MTTDRELLELAAKAAGIDGEYTDVPVFDYYDTHSPYCGIQRKFSEECWNPLTDDSDALWLAVKLELLVNVTPNWSKASDGVTTEQFELHNDDPYAATRRAIVRVAAEIGKRMEP